MAVEKTTVGQPAGDAPGIALRAGEVRQKGASLGSERHDSSSGFSRLGARCNRP